MIHLQKLKYVQLSSITIQHPYLVMVLKVANEMCPQVERVCGGRLWYPAQKQ